MQSKFKLIELSYKNYYLKLSLFFSVFVSFVSSWDFSFMRFWKGFVVLHHEFFHAYSLFFTGGQVYNLKLTENEFGEVLGEVGFHYAIPIVYLSGYIGCIVLGIFLLHESFKYKKSKFILTGFSLYTTLSVLLFTKSFSYAMNFGLAWSVALLFLSILQSNLISSLSLSLLGVGISLYGFLDLKDFIFNISNTDIGRLANWILLEFPNFPLTHVQLAYTLAIFILIFSFGVVLYYFFKIFNLSYEEKELKKFIVEYQKGNLSEDTANFFLERGLSLDGKKFSKNAIDEFYKKGELND